VAHTRPRTTSHMGKCMALLMPSKRCNFRPTGPFGITLRAGCVIHGAVGLIPHLSGIWGGRWWLIWAIFWLFNVPHKIFRHSGHRLCPLTKSVGLQTSSMSFPSTYDAHKKHPLVQNEVLRLEALWVPPPLRKMRCRSTGNWFWWSGRCG
jgi:hypothetical protein